jgi:small-conductance mechanosensitive channel
MIFNKVIYGNITILNLLLSLIIFIASIIIAKISILYFRRSFKDKVSKSHIEIIVKIIWYSIVGVALIFILSLVGVNPAGLLAAGGIAGIVIGFASQSIVSNLISGIFLIIERPINIGDQVAIGESSGFVEDISIISTTIRKYDGLYVRIPNEKVFTTSITNYVAHVVRRVEYIVGIRYSDDAEKAIRIIKNVIDLNSVTLKDPEPQAFVDNLGDNAVNIFVRFWVPASEWYPVKMELLWKLKITLEKEGIEIAFPQRVLWFANELKSQKINNIEGKEKM